VLAIVIPAYRRGTVSDGRKLWGDLRVALHSIEAYADGVDEVVVAWDGPWAPDGMPDDPRIRLLERPPGLDCADGWGWGIEQAQADEIIMMPDDAVLHPDTTRLLLEDVTMIRTQLPDARLGLLGCRSNFVSGAQNVRSPNGSERDDPMACDFGSEHQILATDFIFPVTAWFEKRMWQQIGWAPGLLWYSDMLWSYDLRRAGYSHFISRAYVHHIGMRGTTQAGETREQLDADGRAYLRQHRPDFYELLFEEPAVA
jgi:hypothetical protein